MEFPLALTNIQPMYLYRVIVQNFEKMDDVPVVAPKSKAARTDGDAHQVAEVKVCHSDEPEVMVDGWEDSLLFPDPEDEYISNQAEGEGPTGQQWKTQRTWWAGSSWRIGKVAQRGSYPAGGIDTRRVCRSSLAAETQALAETEQELMFVRCMWQELLGSDLDLQNPGATAKLTEGILVTDAKALYDSIQQGDLPSFSSKEKYTALEVLSLVQNLQDQDTQLRWVNSDMQLADSLTKTGSQDRMRSFLQNGQRWSLAYDPNFVAAKKLRAAAGAGKTPDLDVGLADCSWLDIMNHGSDQRGMSDLQLQVSESSHLGQKHGSVVIESPCHILAP